ncbi:sensor histidine kinase [Limnofasciculus baicalensis]|uniref:histidine kinase n=1 Tax=Limnofasciculus baicalensis BBK-W-15 TaxID=2699891 RepID=A0AAE3KKE1_9CYAN|nr:PAS domain-containing protein [Limnofasciculus baicalensis]MCP2727470.1 PAS domain-containing protein [Limnofasciculus baicalensis BBK-W-15]
MSKFPRLKQQIDELLGIQTNLQAFFDLTPDLFAVLDPNGSFQILSQNWQEILGLSIAERESRCWTEFIHPDDINSSQTCFRWLCLQPSGCKGITIENRFRTQNNSYRWLSWHFSRGEDERLFAVVRDISESQNREQLAPVVDSETEVEKVTFLNRTYPDWERILESEKQERIKAQISDSRFRDLVNDLSDAIVWECEPNSLKFTFVSRSAERILGYPLEQWQRRPDFWINLIHPDDRDWVTAFCREEVKQGRDHEFEYRCLTLDGRIIWLRDRVSLVCDSLGNLQSLRGLMVNITDRKEAETEKEHILEQERANNRAKDEFMATVSHELRTPLTNIRMAIQMLKVVKEPEMRDRYTEIMLTECTREINLVNTLLEFQKLEAGEVTVASAPLQLETWLPSIIEPFLPRINAQKQNLKIDLYADLPILILDGASLERIVVELLNNACKYTPSGGEITLTAYPLNQADNLESVELIISNSGVEIPTDELSRIFDKFYRVPSHDPWKIGGTGLGLALVAKLVELIGGTIRAESQINLVKFIINIPVLNNRILAV